MGVTCSDAGPARALRSRRSGAGGCSISAVGRQPVQHGMQEQLAELVQRAAQRWQLRRLTTDIIGRDASNSRPGASWSRSMAQLSLTVGESLLRTWLSALLHKWWLKHAFGRCLAGWCPTTSLELPISGLACYLLPSPTIPSGCLCDGRPVYLALTTVCSRIVTSEPCFHLCRFAQVSQKACWPPNWKARFSLCCPHQGADKTGTTCKTGLAALQLVRHHGQSFEQL
jgi:hypothetical protein